MGKKKLLPGQEWFTTREVSKMCKFTMSEVYQRIYDGSLPASRTAKGGNYRISREALLKFMKERKVK